MKKSALIFSFVVLLANVTNTDQLQYSSTRNKGEEGNPKLLAHDSNIQNIKFFIKPE